LGPIPNCQNVPVSAAVATCTVNYALGAASPTITASYSGGGILLASMSPPFSQILFNSVVTFNDTGGTQTWTVPAGVTAATFYVDGAQGARGILAGGGGAGGEVQVTLAVAPGTVYQINVGGSGSSNAGGWNGGGAGYCDPAGECSGGGGGASDIRSGAFGLTDRILVGGGGGGSGAYDTGASAGAGGYPNGGTGPSDSNVVSGGGGTQSSGGAGGVVGLVGVYGGAGSLGVGGAGAGTGTYRGGGGGGGGYYGGGGGGTWQQGSDGGGGSSFGPAGAIFRNGVRAGSGQIRIDFIMPTEGTPTLSSVSPSAADAGAAGVAITLTGTHFAPDAVLLFNGSSRPLTVIGSTEATASLAATDLVTTEPLSVANLQISNTGFGGGTSTSVPFLIKSSSVGSAMGSVAPAGGTATASDEPPGQPGVSAALANTGAGAGSASVAVAVYTSSPVSTGFSAGSDYYDVRAGGVVAGDTVVASFTYAGGRVPTLDYWNGTGWAPVQSSGAGPPAVDAAANLITVTFDATSVPRLDQLTGTVFAAGPAPQSIAFPAPGPATYGNAPVSLEATASSGLAVTYSVAPGQPCSINGATAVVLAAGSCVISANQTGDASHAEADSVQATLLIAPAPLTATAANASMPYGGTLPMPSIGYSGFIGSESAANLPAQPAATTTATASSHVGSYAISIAGPAVDGNYAITYVTGTLTVTPVPLTITADDKSQVYGAALPALSVSYSGLVNGDSVASLSSAPVLSTSASDASHVGTYGIIASGAVDGDYSIAYVPGKLTITPAPLTITADSLTKVYGAPMPALSASYSGLVNGDLPASLAVAPTLSTAAGDDSRVSGNPYAITVGGAVDSDYSIAYVAGTLTVTPAPLTITADDQTKPYGAALPAFTASYRGFVNGDTAASLTMPPTLSTTAASSSHVTGSPYAITIGGAADSDYAISYVAGALTMTPVPLTIRADNQFKAYGAALPPFTASYSGFVNGDTAASLTTPATFSTTATQASHVGAYAITVSGAADGDYTISYVPATLTVSRAPLAISADNQTKVYGSPLPPLTVTYTGLVNGDTPRGLSTPPVIATSGSASSDVGGYAITVGGAADPDYSIAYSAGTLTVTPAPLTVTVNDASRYYHQRNPAFSGTITGLLNGDALGGAVTVSYSTALDSNIAAGAYAGVITATMGGSHLFDYTVTPHPGALTIKQMPTTLTFTKPVFTFATGSPATVTAVLREALPPSGVIGGQMITCTFAAGKTVAATTDSAGSSSCTLSGLATGAFSVSAAFPGDHNYLDSSATGVPLYVYRPTNFVIWGGNEPKLADAVKLGMDCNFWGAQWSKQVLAGGWSGDASFKGYADSVGGGTWSAAPGNSSNPPASVDQYIGVIVTTSAAKAGSKVTGNIAELVVLKVDNPAAYAPQPGRPASGTVQAVIG
jgi:hypothetical protein